MSNNFDNETRLNGKKNSFHSYALLDIKRERKVEDFIPHTGLVPEVIHLRLFWEPVLLRIVLFELSA